MRERFPFVGSYFDLIDLHQGLGDLRPWYKRPFPKSIPNAFFLNVLLVPSGINVGRHVDATLRAQVQIDHLVPQKVSVLFLQTPKEMTGGKLNLYTSQQRVASITPMEGMLVHFRGNLEHEVTTVHSDTEPKALRASLVCEQYVIPEHIAEQLPPIRIKSYAGFEAHLEEAKQKQ